MGGELGDETYIVSSIVSTNFHLDRQRQFSDGLSLEKLVLFSFRGYLGEIESEKIEP